MTGKMDDVLKRVLNDKDIFDSPYDIKKKGHIPKLFEGKEWKELGKLFEEKKIEEFKDKIDKRIKEIESQEKGSKREIKKLKDSARWLKLAVENKPSLLKDLFEMLDWYGTVSCNLPNMDNYGRVIERYELPFVKHYFLDKVKGLSGLKSRALRKVLDYVIELYNLGVSTEEIAFFC